MLLSSLFLSALSAEEFRKRNFLIAESIFKILRNVLSQFFITNFCAINTAEAYQRTFA